MEYLKCCKESLDNAGLQSLPAHPFRHFFNICCLADPWGCVPKVASIAKKFGIRPCRTAKIVHDLIERGFLEERLYGCFGLVEPKKLKERTAVNAILLSVKKFEHDATSKLENHLGKALGTIWPIRQQF
jgi:hypothetical protein